MSDDYIKWKETLIEAMRDGPDLNEWRNAIIDPRALIAKCTICNRQLTESEISTHSFLCEREQKQKEIDKTNAENLKKLLEALL